MSGVGTILSVNQNEVKLQIVGGKSRIKFNEKLTKHYIDEMDLGIADKPGYTVDKGWSQGWKGLQKIKDIYRLDDDKSKFLGVEGKWCFVPVRDETNDMIANFVGVDKTKVFIGYNAPFIVNPAVQPNLMYIFRKVVEYEDTLSSATTSTASRGTSCISHRPTRRESCARRFLIGRATPLLRNSGNSSMLP